MQEALLPTFLHRTNDLNAGQSHELRDAWFPYLTGAENFPNFIVQRKRGHYIHRLITRGSNYTTNDCGLKYVPQFGSFIRLLESVERTDCGGINIQGT